jgi:rod shape-determining protein MreC
MLRRYLLLVAIALIVFFLPSHYVAPARDAAVSAVRPLTTALTERNQTIQNAWLNLRNLGELRAERAQLQAQVVALQQQVVDTEELRQQNASLREELGVTGVTSELPKVLASVSLQGDNPLDFTFTINVGEAQGVRLGQPAVSGGVLIGKVIEVRPHSSVVRIITSQRSGVQAWVAEQEEKGFLIGTGNGLVLSELSQGMEIQPGSVVATSGLGGSLPQGILIGEIESKVSAASDPTQRFSVKLPVDPLRVKTLFIILTDQQ